MFVSSRLGTALFWSKCSHIRKRRVQEHKTEVGKNICQFHDYPSCEADFSPLYVPTWNTIACIYSLRIRQWKQIVDTAKCVSASRSDFVKKKGKALAFSPHSSIVGFTLRKIAASIFYWLVFATQVKSRQTRHSNRRRRRPDQIWRCHGVLAV